MAEEPTAEDATADERGDEVEDLKAADAKEVHRAVREEGEAELNRPWSSLAWSALAAGFAIHASLIAQGVLWSMTPPDAPWRMLVVGLGYPIGFAIVVLGRMQFFTESTITAMLPLVTEPSRWALMRTLRLWGVVLAFNLLGTLAVAWAVAELPLVEAATREGIVAVSRKLLSHGAGAIFVTAIPAGFLIAGLAWILPNAREQALLVIFAVTWLVSVAGFSHSVVGSAEAWTLALAAQVDWTGAVLRLILPAVAGNLVGGAGLFAVLAHAQVRGEMKDG